MGNNTETNMQKINSALLFAVFLIAVLCAEVFFNNSQNIEKFSLSNPEEYELDQNIFLVNNGSSYINRLYVNVEIIHNNSIFQSVENISINPKPVSIETDEIGNKIAYFEFDGMKENQTIEISIKYLLKVYSLSFHVNFNDNLMYIHIPKETYEKYILSEKYIECDSDEIKKASNEITENTNTFLAIKKIYDFVRKHMNYTKDTVECKGALCALNNKRGDCTEFTDLFIALCRARGVPARFVTGFVVVPFINKVFAHNWAEVYVENYGWVPVDPTNGLFGVKPNNYIVVSYGRSIEALNSAHFYYFKAYTYNGTIDLKINHSQLIKIKNVKVSL